MVTSGEGYFRGEAESMWFVKVTKAYRRIAHPLVRERQPGVNKQAVSNNRNRVRMRELPAFVHCAFQPMRLMETGHGKSGWDNFLIVGH
jgi:hypothetical protein